MNGTPGQRLREAREARDADLQTAHEGTKIPIRLLEAIERDEYHKLSGPLYARSFLRNYASWVGLDAEEILRGYESVAGGAASTTGDEMVWSEDRVQVRRVTSSVRRDVLIGIAVVVAVALVAWGVWSLMSGREDPDQAALGTMSVVSEQPAPAVQEPAVTVDAPEASEVAQPSARPSLPASGRAESRQERLDRLGADSLMVGLLPAGPAEQSTPALPDAMPAGQGVPFRAGTPSSLVLRVLLPAPTNCSVRCDDQQSARPVVWPEQPRPLPSEDIEPGVAYAVNEGYAVYWGARDTFTLTLGDLSGAGASLNGADLPVDRWQTGQPVVLDQYTLQRLGG